MKRRKIVESTSILGTAAVMTLGLTGCGKQTDTPPASSADDAVMSSTDPAAQGQEPAEAAEGTDTPPATKPDCEGKDAFTEACGYASPTKYAALDPTGIVNES